MRASLRAIRYFLAAADCGSITEAARQLNVSQPSISAAIAQLEADVGVPLLVRHHARGITLTVAGARLTNEARMLVRHADEFAQNALALGQELKGEITIGCFITLAPLYIPTLLAGFTASFPGIAVSLEETDQEGIVNGLRMGRLELALSYHYAVPDIIVAEPLVELPPRLFVSADHPLARHPSIELREVAGEPFILLDLPHSRDYFMGLFASQGITPNIAYRSRSYELVRGLVARGHGYSILNIVPRTGVAYDGSRIVARPIVEQLNPVRMVSLRIGHHTVRPAVKAFADFLSAAFAPGGLCHPASVAAFGVRDIQLA